MKPDELLSELSQLAGSLGAKVSFESFSASVGLGGLCRVKGEPRIIIDKRAGIEERITCVAEAIGKLCPDGVPIEVELSKRARQILQHNALRRAS